MPLYDFVCCECDESFEELVKSSSDTALVRCARCGSARVERQLAAFAAGSSRQSSGQSKPVAAMPRATGGG